jgi:hypothetical protein
MITTYTSSPKPIEKADFKKIGTGTGISRYAHGMYFGEAPTAHYYLEQYQGYFEAAHSFKSNKIDIQEGSPAYDVAQIIIRNKFNRNDALASIDGQEKLVNAINVIWPIENDKPDLNFEFGALHKVKLFGVNEQDVPSWDDHLNIDMIRNYAEIVIDKIFTTKEILGAIHLDDDLKGLELVSALLDIEKNNAEQKIIKWIENGEAPELIQDLIDEEDDDLSPEEIAESIIFSLEDDIESEWMDVAIGNGYGSTRTDSHEVFDLIMDGYSAKALKSLVASHRVNFEIHDELSLGSFYDSLATTAPENCDEKAYASQFFSESLGISIVSAPAMYGIQGSIEYVVLSESALKDASFEVMSKEAIEHEILECHSNKNSNKRDEMDNEHHYKYVN